MNKRILVVDDEESLRDTLGIFLKSAGYAVTAAANYEEAVSHLSTSDFDLVVTDILLGGRSGVDLLREVKVRNTTCPVVMITGYPSLDTAVHATQMGAFEYISKPVRKNDILNVVQRAFAKQELPGTGCIESPE